jgi:murein DD-endopeptidase MepM/ murein hydrolase activator NlpD
MRHRSRLAVTLVGLLTVGASVLISTPRHAVRAADPISDARAQQASIKQQLARQREELAELKATSAALSEQLDGARQALASVTAEYNRVRGLLAQVRDEVAQVHRHLHSLRVQIETLNARLATVEVEIAFQTSELEAREALLQDHLRSAYEQSQTSLLEVLLSADSLDAATTQVGYLLTVSDQDRQLADEIRVLREGLRVRHETLEEGKAVLADARGTAKREALLLHQRRAELKTLRRRTAELRAEAIRKKHERAVALNAALEAQGNVREKIAESERAFDAANALVTRLVAEQQALEEARRRAADEARRNAQQISARGFRWPEAAFTVTQEWGPTNFVLEPPYTYNGVYYPHFHAGIDIAGGCGTPIMAAGTGVVVASGQPLWPYDSGYGVVIDHGGGVQTWYWHISPQVIVSPGQPVTIGQLVGYESSTGNSTGCHLHFAVNDHGVWQNPRFYLP